MFVTESVSVAAMNMAAGPIGIDEGFRSHPYLCPAGKWTIGMGTTRYPDGTPVTQHDGPISYAMAEIYRNYAVQRVEHDLSPLLKRDPTVHQYAAMIRLAYNVGVGAHDGIKGDLADSTLLAKFNAGDIEGAADQFLVWDKTHVNGHIEVLPGLRERRVDERAMFLTPDNSEDQPQGVQHASV